MGAMADNGLSVKIPQGTKALPTERTTMYAKITRDYLAEDESSRAGDVLRDGRAEGQPLDSLNLMRVRLLDDDREVYYHALADDEALEWLFDWAMYDAGVTILQVEDGNGGWTDEIS